MASLQLFPELLGGSKPCTGITIPFDRSQIAYKMVALCVLNLLAISFKSFSYIAHLQYVLVRVVCMTQHTQYTLHTAPNTDLL